MKQPVFGTADAYARALAKVFRGNVTPKQISLLRAHLAAPRHTASFEQLALAVGYKSYRAVNAQYGTFASRVAKQLGVLKKPTEGFWAYVLVKWATGRSEDGHTLFVLRPEVVLALRQLGLSHSSA